MEAKINIAEILESKSQGTKLYSLTYGGCFYQEYTGDFGIEFQNQNGVQFNLDEYGKYCIDGECVIFPSKEMRDWRKFFKKGDVLVSKDRNVHIIFEKFEDDTYTNFRGKHYLWEEGGSIVNFEEDEDYMQTSDFNKANKEDAQEYIHKIEKELGGKLNMESLEIKEPQPEFKDGDIVVYGKSVAICRKICKHTLFPYVSIDETSRLLFNDNPNVSPDECRFATEEEKQQLFSALEKEGKAWDAEKKKVVDLKPKVELKPFDKVLVKDNPYGSWEPALFWKKVDVIDLHPYMVIGGKRYRFCEPYEGNEHLLDD